MGSAPDGQRHWAGTPPYPAPGRGEQPVRTPGRTVAVVVIVAAAGLTVATIVAALVLYAIAATEPLG